MRITGGPAGFAAWGCAGRDGGRGGCGRGGTRVGATVGSGDTGAVAVGGTVPVAVAVGGAGTVPVAVAVGTVPWAIGFGDSLASPLAADAAMGSKANPATRIAMSNPKRTMRFCIFNLLSYSLLTYNPEDGQQ